MIGHRFSKHRLRAWFTAIGLMTGAATSVFAQGGGGGGGGAGGGAGAGAGGVGGAAGAGGAAAPNNGGGAGGGGAGAVNTPFGSVAGGATGAGMVNTPFGAFPNGTNFSNAYNFNNAGLGGNLANTPYSFGNVAGFNPYSGFNPGFNGGVNPVFGNNSGMNTNFSFNPYNGYNPLLGNVAGVSGFAGTPYGSNALLNNPFNPNGLGLGNTLGTNPLLFSPFNISNTNGANSGLGSNPLVNSPVNATAPGQINNAVTNPGLFNPASNASFSANPATVASGQPIGGNGIPVNGYNLTNSPLLNPFFVDNGLNAFSGFGSSYATYGAGMLMSGYPYYVGYPSIGFGAGYPSYYGGYGSPFGYAIGLSPYDQAMYKYQKYALGASRYNLNNARASAAYAAANFYNDLAAATALGSYKTTTGIKPSYSITTGSSRMTPAMRHQAAVQARAQMIPKEKLFDDNGRVRWPNSAPTSPSNLAKGRSEADSAVATVAGEYNKDGRAAVRDVVDAQDKLRDYGTKALDHINKDRPAEAAGLANFLASLDYALTTMGDGTRRVGPDRTKPDNAPKTGGEVLKDSIQKSEKPNDSTGTPTTGPRTGGDVLKETSKTDRPNGSRP